MNNSGIILVNKSALKTWMSGAKTNEYNVAKLIGYDPGNFGRMISGEIEPSKTVIKKLMNLTGYSFEALFEYRRFVNADVYSNDKN